MGIPVVIAENGQGFPVKPVEDNAPVMTVAENGLGAPIVISELGAPFVVQGLRPSWAPDNALFAIETVPDGRSYRCGAPVNINATGGYALDLSGAYVLFGANTPRMTNRGLLVEAASTRLSRYPATPQANWGAAGGTKTAYPGTFLGIFSNATRVATTTGQTWHRVDVTGVTWTSGVPIGFAFYYSSGTSGRGTVVLRHGVNANEATLAGPVGDLAVTMTAAGTVTDVRNVDMGDGIYQISGVFTPNADAASDGGIGFGPSSTIAGQDVVFYGGWVETLTPSSPIIANPTTTAARAADTLTIPGISAGTYDLHLQYASGADRVIEGWAHNDPLPFDSRQIVLAWGEAA